jgi:hypothetical protein
MPRPSRTSQELADEKTVRDWDTAHGIDATGAKAELLRRIDAIAKRREESRVRQAETLYDSPRVT